MALVALTDGAWWPAPYTGINGSSGALLSLNASLGLIDATGEKFAMIGRVQTPNRGSKDIRKVGMLFGTVTKAGGSGLTVSLQDVNLAAGPPYQPDETQDQTVAIANGDAAFASSTWLQTGALSADRTVTHGDLLALVVEYDGSGRLGSDAVNFQGINAVYGSSPHGTGAALKTGGTWAVATGSMPIHVLEFSDGTFGRLSCGYPLTAISTTPAYNSGSTPDEVALEFTVPVECKCDGAYIVVNPSASADFDIVLYEGTTAKATVSIDANTFGANGSSRPCEVTFAEVTLSPGQTYYLAVKPTTANNVQPRDFDVSASGHFQAHPGGTSWRFNSRTDGGAWGAGTSTRRLQAGIRISAVHDGSGGGGGLKLAGRGGLAG